MKILMLNLLTAADRCKQASKPRRLFIILYSVLFFNYV